MRTKVGIYIYISINGSILVLCTQVSAGIYDPVVRMVGTTMVYKKYILDIFSSQRMQLLLILIFDSFSLM
jgi:hypothetical protein